VRATSRCTALVTGIAVLAMTSGACSQRQAPGTPTAGSPDLVEPRGSVTSTARPAVLPLDDVMPCELMTDAMRQQFAVDRPDAPSAVDPRAPGCGFISSAVGRYVVVTVRDKGVAALGRPAEATVGGFPAVEIRRLDIPSVCHFSIDVADGQRLDVEIQRRDRTMTQDQICTDTRVFAEAVLATLRQKLGR
jgi:Protein of unknown function (DUF3558)